MTEISQWHFIWHLTIILPMRFLPPFVLSRNSEDKQAHKLCRRKRASTQVLQHTLLLFCVIGRQQLHSCMIHSPLGVLSLLSIKTGFSQTHLLRKSCLLVRGHCQDLLRANKAGLLPLTHDIRRMYIWLYISQARFLQWAVYWRVLKQPGTWG